MLEKPGLKEDFEMVNKAWIRFLEDSVGFQPKEYPLLFPQNLLKQIVDEFFTFYQNADLASFPEIVLNGTNSIAFLLNDAWKNAQSNSLDYYSYEIGSINGLKNNYGLPKISNWNKFLSFLQTYCQPHWFFQLRSCIRVSYYILQKEIIMVEN
jgi:hypothetical protein